MKSSKKNTMVKVSYDIQRDVHEAFDSRFNPLAEQIPQDEFGFQEGTFTVTITWSPDETS